MSVFTYSPGTDATTAILTEPRTVPITEVMLDVCRKNKLKFLCAPQIGFPLNLVVLQVDKADIHKFHAKDTGWVFATDFACSACENNNVQHTDYYLPGIPNYPGQRVVLRNIPEGAVDVSYTVDGLMIDVERVDGSYVPGFWLMQSFLRGEEHETQSVDSDTFRRASVKISPNAPCACGSGKKAKRCCYRD